MTGRGSASRAAVLVPLYKESLTSSEEFSFRNTLATLSKHDIYVVGPEKLIEFLYGLKEKLSLRFEIKCFSDKYFLNISGYNRLLKSRAFYKAFESYEYILILQTDALVLSDQLEEWCDRNYSYIGAPWFKGFDSPVRPLSFLGVGNGGFSLRKVRDFIRVLSVPRHIPNIIATQTSHHSGIRWFAGLIKNCLIFSYSIKPLQPKINEDEFWGMLVANSCQFFTVPAPEDAIPFAFEVMPEYLYEINNRQLPFGCHAWEKYDPEFWRNILSERGIELP